MRNVLITGGAGFIGSNFIRYLLNHDAAEKLVNLDALTYAGHLENLVDIQSDSRYLFIQGDIRNRPLLDALFAEHELDTVVNFAAETHVDRSIEDPALFLNVNVGGTQTLLEAALQHWRLKPDDKHCREYRRGCGFLQVSTDEVYGSLPPAAPSFREDSPLKPNSPYSASKASADQFVRAYHQTYGLPCSISRCCNNFGPYQFPEKLIPLMILNALADKPLPLYGDGLQIRDWLYVEDQCSALKAILDNGQFGDIYNIGATNEFSNLEIVRMILHELGKPESLIEHVVDRPGHDRRYALDNSRITNELGWRPAHTFRKALKATIDWYLNNHTWVEQMTNTSYQDYYARMYAADTP
ncbi:MAG: dTDP-glucose 4,6-dehydratase [Coriobacteriales bacterium]|jgi:dTDP-glucose 4,6-dehydratase|nr:dTDP-glucose 4,6-dehydratase [Coriobacteriales bacterium]